jgi:hypothetical protein
MLKDPTGLINHLSDKCRYEIRIQGTLNARWSEWFYGMNITVERSDRHQPFTSIFSPAIDQSKLRGMLNKIWDLNLSLISVQRMLDPGLQTTSPDER